MPIWHTPPDAAARMSWVTPRPRPRACHVGNTLDPKNANIKQGINSLDNMLALPGKEAAYADNQPVPHGTIRQVWYQSSTLSTQRRMHIYTPPGYDQSTDKLPVLYLLHGGGDEDSGWSTIGRAGFILDNLLANAIKFTPAGGEIELSLAQKSGDALVTVRDS